MSFLKTLSVAARAVFPFVESGVAQGLSIERIGKAARAAGYSIANTTLRTLVNKQREVWRYQDTLKNIPLSRSPNPDRVPVTLKSIASNFSWKVEVTGASTSWGKAWTGYITIREDALSTTGHIKDTAEQIAMERVGHGAYPGYIESVKIVGLVRREELY